MLKTKPTKSHLECRKKLSWAFYKEQNYPELAWSQKKIKNIQRCPGIFKKKLNTCGNLETIYF